MPPAPGQPGNLSNLKQWEREKLDEKLDLRTHDVGYANFVNWMESERKLNKKLHQRKDKDDGYFG